MMIYRFETKEKEEALLIVKRHDYVAAVSAVESQLEDWHKFGFNYALKNLLSVSAKEEIISIITKELLDIIHEELGI